MTDIIDIIKRDIKTSFYTHNKPIYHFFMDQHKILKNFFISLNILFAIAPI